MKNQRLTLVELQLLNKWFGNGLEFLVSEDGFPPFADQLLDDTLSDGLTKLFLDDSVGCLALPEAW